MIQVNHGITYAFTLNTFTINKPKSWENPILLRVSSWQISTDQYFCCISSTIEYVSREAREIHMDSSIQYTSLSRGLHAAAAPGRSPALVDQELSLSFSIAKPRASLCRHKCDRKSFKQYQIHKRLTFNAFERCRANARTLTSLPMSTTLRGFLSQTSPFSARP